MSIEARAAHANGEGAGSRVLRRGGGVICPGRRFFCEAFGAMFFFGIWWGAAAGARAELEISELMAVADENHRDGDGAPSDWIEITNSGSAPEALGGYSLSNDVTNPRKWVFPEVEIAAGGSLVVFASGKAAAPGELHAGFTLDRGGDYLALVAPDGVTVVSEFSPKYPAQFENISYGVGAGESVRRETLVARGAEARYLIPADGSLGDTWKESPAVFDDSAWRVAPSGFGFETPGGTLEAMITTDIGDAMRAVNGSGYFRFPFRFDATDKRIVSMQLRVRSDDGFVAYLNGVEAGGYRQPPDPSWNSTAAGGLSRGDGEVLEVPIAIDLSANIGAVIDGENVLAIQGMNSTADGSDFALDAELLAEVRGTSSGAGAGAGEQRGYFETPTPGAPNGAIKNPPPAEVAFSVTSRLFSDDFSVELSNATPGAVIRYTTDRSVPTNDLNDPSREYTEPIEVTGSTQIRARAFLPGALDGPVKTETFLKMADNVPTFSSNLPVVVVSTLGGGRPPESESPLRREAFVFIFEPDPGTGRTTLTQMPKITARGSVRKRGSSSAVFLKYSMSLETWNDGDDEDRNIEPLGLPREADWILNSRYQFDLALMRNPFIYEISRQIGRYAARSRFVEIYNDVDGGDVTDNDYFGVYAFMERIEVDPNRVDIIKIDPWENSEPEITGGYIFKKDRPDPGEPSISVRGMGELTLVDPSGLTISREQRSWLVNHLNEFDRALGNAPEGINPTTGKHFSEYIDVDSWIDHHWLNLLVMNIDWGRHSSYFHRDRGGRIVAGPLWDFDRSLGDEDGRSREPRAWDGTNNNGANVDSSRTWFDSRFPWWGDLLGPSANPAQAHYPDIRQRHTDRWFELRKGAFSMENLRAVIDSLAGQIREGQARNFARWTRYRPNGGAFAEDGLTGWEAEVSHMKGWLAARTAWIDSQYLQPPAFNTPGGIVEEGFALVMGSPDGQVYYTVDGTDPRAPGGSPAAGAIPFSGGPVEETLIDDKAVCRYLVPADGSLGLTWTQPAGVFDDSGWTAASNGVGFESSAGFSELVATDIEQEMKGVNAGCYVRYAFDFGNAGNVNSLTLSVWSDDGFVAYLNGAEAGSLLKPSPLQWDSATDGGQGRPGGDTAVLEEPIVIDLGPLKDAIRNGRNVIAIHGMNSTPGGSDFLVRATLTVNHNVSPTPVTVDSTRAVTARTFDGAAWSAPERIVLVLASDLAGSDRLVISEIMPHPAAPGDAEIAAGFDTGQEFEYVELLNIGDRPVALAGMRFSDGIEFDFGESNVSLLEPGARGLVVKNRAAFEFRHGTAAAGRILGEFQNGTVLKNEGERLALTSSNGEVARDFTYGTKAPWPEAPAEGGFSLVLVAPETNPDHALGSNWRLSARPGGTPGSGEELSFAIWAISYGVLDPGSDEDLDGRSALLEYAMGSDPTVPDPENLPGGRVDAGDYLTFSFHRSILAEDIVLTLERSSNLEVWVPVGEEIVLAEETPNGDGTANRIYRSTLPLDGFSEKIMFLRVRVTLK